MEILASTIDHQLDRIYTEFEDTFGYGPCGVYAVLRREDGWGDVAVCIASIGQTEFTHYIVVQDGAIIDMANPLGESLAYNEVEILDADEMPEMCETVAINWLRARIT